MVKTSQLTGHRSVNKKKLFADKNKTVSWNLMHDVVEYGARSL